MFFSSAHLSMSCFHQGSGIKVTARKWGSMGPGYTMLRPSLFFKFFFGKIIAIINGTTTTKSLCGGKRVRLQV